MLLPRTQSPLRRNIFFFRSFADLVLWRLQNFDWKITASPLELGFQRNVDTHQISKVSDYEMVRSKLGKGFGPTKHQISRKTLSSSSKGLLCLRMSIIYILRPSFLPCRQIFLRTSLKQAGTTCEVFSQRIRSRIISHSAYVNYFVTFATKVPYLTFCDKMWQFFI